MYEVNLPNILITYRIRFWGFYFILKKPINLCAKSDSVFNCSTVFTPAFITSTVFACARLFCWLPQIREKLIMAGVSSSTTPSLVIISRKKVNWNLEFLKICKNRFLRLCRLRRSILRHSHRFRIPGGGRRILHFSTNPRSTHIQISDSDWLEMSRQLRLREFVAVPESSYSKKFAPHV